MGDDTVVPSAVPPRANVPGPSPTVGTTGSARKRPPGAQTVGKAVPRDQYKPATDPATKPGVPKPPDAGKAASDAVKSAAAAAARTRKRLASGTAGRVTLPSPNASQGAIVGTAPVKTLIGGGA